MSAGSIFTWRPPKKKKGQHLITHPDKNRGSPIEENTGRLGTLATVSFIEICQSWQPYIRGR